MTCLYKFLFFHFLEAPIICLYKPPSYLQRCWKKYSHASGTRCAQNSGFNPSIHQPRIVYWQVRADGPFFWNPVWASPRATIIIIELNTAHWNSCSAWWHNIIKTQLQLLYLLLTRWRPTPVTLTVSLHLIFAHFIYHLLTTSVFRRDLLHDRLPQPQDPVQAPPQGATLPPVSPTSHVPTLREAETLHSVVAQMPAPLSPPTWSPSMRRTSGTTASLATPPPTLMWCSNLETNPFPLGARGHLSSRPMVSSLWVLKQRACQIPSRPMVSTFKKYPPRCPAGMLWEKKPLGSFTIYYLMYQSRTSSFKK